MKRNLKLLKRLDRRRGRFCNDLDCKCMTCDVDGCPCATLDQEAREMLALSPRQLRRRFKSLESV